jgi:hypothetical protein
MSVLVRSDRWRTILATAALPGRVELETLLRDSEAKAVLAGDPRLARALRPVVWMLGADTALLPRARPRPPVILVPGADVERAKAEYAAARKTLTQAEVLERYCTPPVGTRPGSASRMVWLGADRCLPAVVPRSRSGAASSTGVALENIT